MKIQKLFSMLFILVLLLSKNGGLDRAVFAEDASSSALASPSVIRVPEDYLTLQNAINNVPDGGIIDLRSGTYSAPAGGFLINDMQKGFTIRARQNGGAILDGGGSRNILQAINSDLSMGRPIIFQGLVFANGYSNTAGLAGGATFYNAYATFVDCTFRDNVAGLAGRGGGTFVAISSTAFFFNCTWENNTAVTSGGGLEINENAKAYINDSQFIGNRTNPPGHSLTSAGGAIHVGNSTLRVSNTRFENNQAGYVGGAIYIVGTWTAPYTTPRSDVIIANCTFINNQAIPDPSVSMPYPTEAGAIHAENQTTARIYNSRFITNSAMIGGGVNNYRALVYIYNSVFQGNRATGTSMGGFGAAIAANSNDVSSDPVNYRSAYLEVRDSLIQGRYGGVTIVSQDSGGIGIGGDYNRTYGANGVSQMGTVADNRAVAIISNVIFTDLDVQKPSGGVGGALVASLTALSMQDSLIINSDAIGTDNSSGGGMAILDQTQANVSDSTFGHNTTQRYGGAIFAQGSELNMLNCNLIENSNSTQYGSAIFAAQDDGRNHPATGVVQGSVISNNNGLPIYDDDRTNGPINDAHYNNNQFFDAGGTGAIIYSDSISGFSSKTVAQLNSLVVSRANGTSTDKAQVNNIALSTAPNVGKILAAPLQILSTAANGDSAPPTLAYLGYAWSGGSATLDGQAVSGNAGVSTAGTGSHTLSVGGTNFTADISQAPTPAATFTASGASPVTLNWSVTAGTFLDVAIDHGVTITSSSNGSVQVSPPVYTDYWLYVITQEGGIVKSVNSGVPILNVPSSINIIAGKNIVVNKGYFTIKNDGTSTLQWTATSQTPSLITMDTPDGQTTILGTIAFTLNVDSLSPGDYVGTINVDAGVGGTALVTVNVKLVDILYKNYLSIIFR